MLNLLYYDSDFTGLSVTPTFLLSSMASFYLESIQSTICFNFTLISWPTVYFLLILNSLHWRITSFCDQLFQSLYFITEWVTTSQVLPLTVHIRNGPFSTGSILETLTICSFSMGELYEQVKSPTYLSYPIRIWYYDCTKTV